MDATLLVLLLASLAFAALLAYFIFVRREWDIGGRGRAGIFTILFVIAPVLVIAMVLQSGADTRLQEAGFVPHASFDSVSGVAAGLGDEPYWVFDSAAGRDAILAFYRLPENHPGWRLTGDSAGRLVFERQGKRMLVNVDERHVFFTRFEADTAHME